MEPGYPQVGQAQGTLVRGRPCQTKQEEGLAKLVSRHSEVGPVGNEGEHCHKTVPGRGTEPRPQLVEVTGEPQR